MALNPHFDPDDTRTPKALGEVTSDLRLDSYMYVWQKLSNVWSIRLKTMNGVLETKKQTFWEKYFLAFSCFLYFNNFCENSYVLKIFYTFIKYEARGVLKNILIWFTIKHGYLGWV